MRLSVVEPAPGPPGRLWPLSLVYRPGGRELRPSYPKPGAASRLGVVPLPDSGTYSHFPHHQVFFYFIIHVVFPVECRSLQDVAGHKFMSHVEVDVIRPGENACIIFFLKVLYSALYHS